jgi:hypothetical protein
VSYVDLGSDPISGERQRKAVAADTYGEVKKLHRELLEQRDRGVKVTSAKGWTVASWYWHWVEVVIKTEMNEGTYGSYSGDVKNSIAASPISRTPLGKLQPSQVNAWKAWLQRSVTWRRAHVGASLR